MFGRLLWAALLIGASVCPAWAENDKSRARAHSTETVFAVTAAPRSLATSRDRLAAYAYFRQEYLGGNCPAGLVKRPIGCQMPGEPKRQWTLGQRLSPITQFFPLPLPLLDRLSRPPGDVKYVRVDSDILLMELDTQRVIEFVTSVADLQDPNWPVVGEADRLALVSYFRDDYTHGSCPIDLARTERGCETRPLWAIGEPLDPLAISEQLPDRLVIQLKALPDGYRYVRVADHVLVMVVATRVIRADVLDLADLSGFSPYPRRPR
jgi:hypothetical protein